jgi:uncharacterized protein involved in exopolysaccharide biosynthesis
MLYTGLASGSSIEMDKSFNYFATNIAFDNLINIIKSRETQEEVAVRLLSQHLFLDEADVKYISKDSYEKLKEVIPEEIYEYVVKSDLNFGHINDSLATNDRESPNTKDYEQTVVNLLSLMRSNNTNFVYSLLNFEHPYYSLEALSKVKAERISTSDLVKLSYETDDPGICQQTLAILNDVCIRKYKDLKEKGSDVVVKYFEAQLNKSENKLKEYEQKLLRFNQQNNIINYYEQSKAVAIVKEEMDVEFNKKKAELAGSEASTKKLEEKLEIQELVQEKSNRILENKKRLGEINYEIAISEAKSSDYEGIDELRKQADALQKEIKTSVDQLYKFQNSVEGVPITEVLPEWVDKVVETEDIKAKLEIMEDQNKEIQKQYALYAPAGANLKRIEREIEVAEQEYLEILHGLNLAKLKFQDTQLSSNLKAVDPPYFPLKPIPSKRKLIVIAIVLVSAILLLGTILFIEYFDNTLKNVSVASEKLNIPAMGMLAKIYKTNGQLDLNRVQNRLMELLMQNFNHTVKVQENTKNTKIITVLSTRKEEGKTVIIGNMAKKLKDAGKSVLVLNHSNSEKNNTSSTKYTLLHRLLGFKDPRNDYSQPFLNNLTSFLSNDEYLAYDTERSFYKASDFKDLRINNYVTKAQEPDYVLIELPNILDTNYPADLLAKSDLSLLVCRSNRLWSKADDNLLNNIKELTGPNLQFIINGVEIEEVETLLGELPKKRSKARKTIKNLLRFQFYSGRQI